jgi:Hypothetical glycosyl hydrolase family 15
MRGRFIKAAPVIAFCLVTAAIASVQALPASTTAGSNSTAVYRICSGCASSGTDFSHYQYVILHAWDYAMIPALKRANPQIKVLLYKDVSVTVDYGGEQGLIPAGVDWAYANSNHPEWFSHKNSARIETYYGGDWQMNVGMAGYQDMWASNVITDATAHGWDGVFGDDQNLQPFGDLPFDEYPNQSSYQAAARSFLANVGPKILAAGLLFIPNIQHDGSQLTESVWKDWIQFTSGGNLEHYAKWGEDNSLWLSGSDWNAEQTFERDTEAAGKIFMGMSYAPTSDVRSMRYARASFLLDWNGGPSALVFVPNPYINDPWSPEWTVDIGMPVGSRYQVGSAYRRDYTGGTVVVNPSSASQQVNLGGTYLMPDSSSVTSVTLTAMTGLVLRSPATTPTTTTPTTTTPTTTTPTTTTPTTTTPTTTKKPPTSKAKTVKIKLRARRLSGLSQVTLKWIGAHSRTVNIYRSRKQPNAVRRVAAVNTGSYTARLGKRAVGVYYFKVCEVGMSSCSARVPVYFSGAVEK